MRPPGCEMGPKKPGSFRVKFMENNEIDGYV